MSGASTYKMIVALCLLSAAGCGAPKAPSPEAAPDPGTPEARNFDPLAYAQDTVPLKPVPSADATTLVGQVRLYPGDERLFGDTLANKGSRQIFRVQLLTADTYSDGRHALLVAQEIFDRPVSLDYEVPYYKLRVGDFPSRAAADAYLEKAKAAGYDHAWVIVAMGGVKQAPDAYESTVDTLGTTNATTREGR